MDDDESFSPQRQAVGTGATTTSNRPTLSRNGVPLHPQPTDDPLDPLNWTSFKKHIILAIVMWL
jgi:hypothetical protein